MSLPLDELLATLGALAKDDTYNSAALEERGDVVATMTEQSIRARAERMWISHERTRGEDQLWRMERRAELLARGDARIRERVVELQRKAMADFTAAREKAQRQTFTYTNDPNLSQVENDKRREKAMEAHMHNPMRVAEAIREVQRTQEGMFANNPSSNYFEGEARRQVEGERPWLFAHLKPKSEGGSAARATSTRSVNDLAADLLERHPVHTSKRTAAAMTLDRTTKRYVPRACTTEEKALARDILETYRAHDALISGTPSMTQEQCAESLARAVSSMGDKGPRFLATCMRAAGIR